MRQLQDVNTSDVRAAVELGCRAMGRLIDSEQNTCYFGVHAVPEARLSCSSSYSDAHVPGRHLNALLNAEDAAATKVPDAWIEYLARVAFFSHSGPSALPLNRQAIDGALVNLDTHNFREGFHALYSLAAFRRSERALELAEKCISTVFALWDPEKGWNREKIEGELGLNFRDSTFIMGLARAIGPLVKLHRSTGSASALELAVVLKEKALSRFFTEEGRYDSATFGAHTHSTTCVMSSLAQLADWTHDGPLMERVRAFYDNGLWQIRDELGWVTENTAEKTNPDRGEGNNTGDIVETALILGKWGYLKYYGDAERVLRGHLLPSQLRDISFAAGPSETATGDAYRDVAERIRGSWGFPAPYGHLPLGAERVSFNTDIVGGVVGSLCEVLRSTVMSDALGHHVNLHFDHETTALTVQSPYRAASRGKLRIKMHTPAPLWVRIPAWAGADQVVVRGTPKVPCWSNGYLLLSDPPVEQWLEFAWPLPQHEIVLKHRTRSIRTVLRGDEVVAMEDHGASLTFFDGFD
jgi:hypothetical protein